jgi:hypothetical protein
MEKLNHKKFCDVARIHSRKIILTIALVFVCVYTEIGLTRNLAGALLQYRQLMSYVLSPI